MRILLTNDDGINAPGLAALAAIAAEVAGPDGEVWTVAPAFEQSGVGHCISYTRPLMIVRLDERRFAAEGTPADCVLAGIYEIMPGDGPDLILSGVNRGNNAAENALYSGTLGAAIEAALQGRPTIALSQFMGPLTAELDDPFEAARHHGADVVRALLAHGFTDHDADYRTFYNVNFPPVAAADVKGRRVVAQGRRRDTNYSAEPYTSPTGRHFLWLRGGPQLVPTAPDTDVTANLDGHIAITPMRCDLTAHDRLAELQGQLG